MDVPNSMEQLSPRLSQHFVVSVVHTDVATPAATDDDAKHQATGIDAPVNACMDSSPWIWFGGATTHGHLPCFCCCRFSLEVGAASFVTPHTSSH